MTLKQIGTLARLISSSAICLTFLNKSINLEELKESIKYFFEKTGTRITYSATLELHEQNKRYALITMCIGVGQGIALIIENNL